MFYEWKLSVEENEKNHFIYYKGKETTADGKSKLTFRCFGDGVFKRKSKNICHEKNLGTNKINSYCPGKMDVFFMVCGEVNVEFFKTHVGNQCELGRMSYQKMKEKTFQRVLH